MRRTLRVLVVITCVGAFALATAPTADAISKAQLRSKLLGVSDLPTGWSVDNSSASPTQLGGCLSGINQVGKQRGETKVQAKFVNGTSPYFFEGLTSGPYAAADYQRFHQVFAKCRSLTISSEGTTIRLSVGAMSFPRIGSRSAAWALTGSYQDITLGLDFVEFRVKNIAGLVGYFDVGPPDVTQLQS